MTCSPSYSVPRLCLVCPIPPLLSSVQLHPLPLSCVLSFTYDVLSLQSLALDRAACTAPSSPYCSASLVSYAPPRYSCLKCSSAIVVNDLKALHQAACATLCYTVLHCATLCCTVLHCATLCCTVLHFAALCCTVLHCATPYYTSCRLFRTLFSVKPQLPAATDIQDQPDIQGWPEPYDCTVYEHIVGDILAENTVSTPCIYGPGQPY